MEKLTITKDKIECMDNDGNVFLADVMLPCPFCGADGELSSVGNSRTKNRKAIAKCTNKMCRCTMINATLRYDAEWVIKVTIEAWNRRVGGHGA